MKTLQVDNMAKWEGKGKGGRSIEPQEHRQMNTGARHEQDKEIKKQLAKIKKK